MISIPLSLAIGLALLHFTGFSLNQLSIAGFVLALGLLVDDSIVVVENISRYLRAGYSRIEAAIAATDQIALAVIGCTATLLFAFLPLLFLPEGVGMFIRSLPAAVLYTVLASLLVALTVIPFLSSRLLTAGGDGGHGNRVLSILMAGIHRIYAPALKFALAHPRTHAARGPRLDARCARPRAGDGHERVSPGGHPAVPHCDRDAGRRQHRRHRSRAALRGAPSSPARGGPARASRTSGVATRAFTTTSSRRRPNATSPTCSSSSIASNRAARHNCSRTCGRPSPSIRARASLVDSYANGPPIEAPIEIGVAGPGAGPAARGGGAGADRDRGDTGHARRRQPAAAATHRSRPAGGCAAKRR